MWTPVDTWGRRVTWDVSSTRIITSFSNSPPPSLLPLPTLLTFLTTSTNPPLLQPPLPPTLLSYNPLFHSFTPSSTLSFLTLLPLSPSLTLLLLHDSPPLSSSSPFLPPSLPSPTVHLPLHPRHQHYPHHHHSSYHQDTSVVSATCC
ncbi:hypothetical protein Pmani_000977 [Petrolisthes manimaculis]|uniref:Uncharacterized protein n=1 Tax=Petrolisthes manimaculis TaxID=1843537 RepID=A0AAE1US34_9EUCA|nr:hypothetical protein Pmani_000977 [Petrolisthes manimaculis]